MKLKNIPTILSKSKVSYKNILLQYELDNSIIYKNGKAINIINPEVFKTDSISDICIRYSQPLQVFYINDEDEEHVFNITPVPHCCGSAIISNFEGQFDEDGDMFKAALQTYLEMVVIKNLQQDGYIPYTEGKSFINGLMVARSEFSIHLAVGMDYCKENTDAYENALLELGFKKVTSYKNNNSDNKVNIYSININKPAYVKKIKSTIFEKKNETTAAIQRSAKARA